MSKTITVFQHHPELSRDSCQGIVDALTDDYRVLVTPVDQVNAHTLSQTDLVVFPGGLGEASSYDRFFRRRTQNSVADYVSNGGRYLGICMGAYWAGTWYFDILQGLDTVQYIRRPNSDIRRSYATVAKVNWNGQSEHMFFYDGCAIVGDLEKCHVVAQYANGDAMAVIQDRVGVIGCHPESQLHWYQTPRQYIHGHWHHGHHATLLKKFVDQLMEN